MRELSLKVYNPRSDHNNHSAGSIVLDYLKRIQVYLSKGFKSYLKPQTIIIWNQ